MIVFEDSMVVVIPHCQIFVWKLTQVFFFGLRHQALRIAKVDGRLAKEVLHRVPHDVAVALVLLSAHNARDTPTTFGIEHDCCTTHAIVLCPLCRLCFHRILNMLLELLNTAIKPGLGKVVSCEKHFTILVMLMKPHCHFCAS